MGMFNLDSSIESFSRSSLNYGLAKKMLVYLSTKNMIFDKKRQLDNLIFSLLRCDSARVQKPATICAQQMVPRKRPDPDLPC